MKVMYFTPDGAEKLLTAGEMKERDAVDTRALSSSLPEMCVRAGVYVSLCARV